MSSLEHIKQIIISAFSLQTQIKKHTDILHLVFPRIKKRKISNRKPFASKRISSVISITHEGSLTVEAALVIPIFLFAVTAVLSFTDILRLQMKMDSAMTQCAKELAVYGYAGESIAGEVLDDIPFPEGTLFSETYVRNRVISELGQDYLSRSPANGSGTIHFLGSRIMKNDRIELDAAYYVTPYFALSPKSGFLTGNRAVARAFRVCLYNAGRRSISQKQRLPLPGSVHRKSFYRGYIRYQKCGRRYLSCMSFMQRSG